MVTNNAIVDKVGGLERYVADLAAALVRRGVTVRVVAKRWNDEAPDHDEQPDGVIVERYRVPNKRNPLYALLYAGYVAAGVGARTRGRGRIIHAHMGLPALPLALTGRPYLLTFHAPVWRELLRERQGSYRLPAPAQRLAIRTLRGIESRAARGATETVVLSEFMRAELGLLDARAGETAHVIAGGVDTHRFRPGSARTRVCDGGMELFTARRLTPRTGLDELVRAMPAIRVAFPQVHLDIAGVGAMEDNLRWLIDVLDLRDAVHLLGRISDEDLIERYRRADLVVMPTRELEGFGLTTAEALACGAAVVGTPAGATPELLQSLDPGLISDDVTADGLSRAINSLLADPGRLALIRSRARARVAPAMSWDTIADRYLEIYERVGCVR
jgi:glycosyltransferase involved in cell wall biosynthesis